MAEAEAKALGTITQRLAAVPSLFSAHLGKLECANVQYQLHSLLGDSGFPRLRSPAAVALPPLPAVRAVSES